MNQKMSKLLQIWLAFFMVAAPFATILQPVKAQTNVTVPSQPIPFASDYATSNLKDTWDMSEFTDVSQYLNGSGRYAWLKNIESKDGVFSATSIGDRYSKLAYFYMLFPGYENAMKSGKIGALHPIRSAEYTCMYIAIKSDSPQWVQNGPSPDGFRILWYKDLNMMPQGQAPNGGTVDIWMHMYDLDSGKDAYPIRNWKMFKVDLTNPPAGFIPGGTRWQDSAEWQGIEINPTLYSNVNFKIDWVTLTPTCASEPAYQAPISFASDWTVNSLWINPVGTTRNIRLATNVNGDSGKFTLDTKGIAPGSYRVGLGNKTTCCTQWSESYLTINTPAKVDFIRPSMTSGEEYAPRAGTSWTMNSTNGIASITCANWSVKDGSLNLDTAYPDALPAECKGSDTLKEADPKVVLNTPIPLPANTGFRYLSFRMYQNGDYSRVADGMIARWLWTNSDTCTYTSNEIPLEVGWNNYSFDLNDAWNGLPIEHSWYCPEGIPWSQHGTITQMRLDPNENWTGEYKAGQYPGDNDVPAMMFNQKLAWIKLTRMDTVNAGTSFPVQIQMNKPVDQSSLTFYYTTTLGNPTQTLAQRLTIAAPAPTSDKPYRNYIPTTMSNFNRQNATFNWDTAGVRPGQYYLCVVTNDGKNTTSDCSSAPVEVK